MKEEFSKEIIGRLERIDIPEFSLSGIEAKVDTGAYNGAIHVSLVSEFERDGKEWIRFVLLDEDHPEFNNKVYETDVFEEKSIRSSSGHVQRRYVVPVTVILKGRELKAKLSLTSRKDLRYPILLGRKIIKKHFVVDASKTFTETNNPQP